MSRDDNWHVMEIAMLIETTAFDFVGFWLWLPTPKETLLTRQPILSFFGVDLIQFNLDFSPKLVPFSFYTAMQWTQSISR